MRVACRAVADPVIVVHAGCGNPAGETVRDEPQYHRALAEALEAGWAALASGGALDGVQAAVESLEDCPLFNAGRGSVLTTDGHVEMDAALMSGTDLRAGAVALDADGHLAAATSTGGVRGQLPGRVGDSPQIGAGTYADDATCAVSATGDGELIVRALVAAEVASLMRHVGTPLEEACRRTLNDRLGPLGGEAGLIAVDGNGNVATPANTKVMHRGVARNGAVIQTAVFVDR